MNRKPTEAEKILLDALQRFSKHPHRGWCNADPLFPVPEKCSCYVGESKEALAKFHALPKEQRDYDETADTAVDLIVDDLNDRGGFEDEWRNADTQTRWEIRKVWAKLIVKTFSDADSKLSALQEKG